ncbi:MAG: LysR substrate-binding domain-containing protein, partial [Sandaracinaceae bacterium]
NSFPQERLAEMLKQGDLDLAIFDGEMTDDVLTVVRLTEITHGLFCGPRHPLATIARPTLAQIQAHPFVAPAPIPGGRVPDQWPPHLPRTIGLEVNHIRVGIEACQEGSFLAVLPVPLGAQAGLVRLPARGIGTSSLCAMHRETLGDPGPVDAMVTALRRRSRAV